MACGEAMADEPDASISGGTAPCALHAVCLATVFLVRLEVSVLILAIPPIASEFGCSLEAAAWVHLGPGFAAIMFAPPVGKAADMYGLHVVWRCAILLLVVSTWLAAWSPNLVLLLVARVGTGVSQAGVFSPALALMTRGLDPARRGAIASRIQAADTLGSSFGMLVGGIAIDHVDWRWIFLAPAPLMTLACLASFWAVPARAAQTGSTGDVSLTQFDLLGTLIFACSSFCGLFALHEIKQHDSGINRGK